VTYVNGYALVSARGKDAFSSVVSLRKGECTPATLNSATKYYKIDEAFSLPYYDMIEKIIRDAIAHAGLDKEDLADMALFLGTSSAKLPLNESHTKKHGTLLHDLYMDEITQIMADRIGIQGFRTIISTACTSSSNALIQAKEMIESGLIQKAVVVGVELYNLLSIKGFESFMLLSNKEIKPFDKKREGIILGEAVSAIILSKKSSPFVFLGGAVKVDTNSITAPTLENLAMVMNEVLKDAEITAKEISVVKTHSTATSQNDDAEAKALHKVFPEKIPKVLALKPYIGHTMGACGSSELVLFLEALTQGFIPKSIQFETIDPECNIVPSLEEAMATNGYYMFNYFGFGGNNSSLILQYKGK
jgi:3-oxoacyl-[acyl-carrier-protein] synthase-1